MPPTHGKWTDDSRTPHLGARFRNTRTMMARLAHLSNEDKGRWIGDALDFRGCTALDTSAWREPSPAPNEDTSPAPVVKKEEDDAALGVAASSSSSTKATSCTKIKKERNEGVDNESGGSSKDLGGSSGRSASGSSAKASSSKKKIKQEAVDDDDKAPKATASKPKRSALKKATNSASPSIVQRSNVATSSKATTPDAGPRLLTGGIPWGHDEDGGRRPGRIGDDIGFGFGDEEEGRQRPATRRRLA